MPLLSSPLAYPPSSSPPVVPEKRKSGHHIDAPSDTKRRHPNGENERVKKPLFRTLHIDDSNKENFNDVQLPRDAPSTVKGPFIDDDDEDDEDGIREDNVGDTHGKAPILPRPGNDGDVSTASLNMFDLVSSSQRKTLDEKSTLGTQECSAGVPKLRTSSGKAFSLRTKKAQEPVSFERLIAGRSITTPGKAAKSYYGINIHELLDQAAKEAKQIQHKSTETVNIVQPSIETPLPSKGSRKGRNLLWTEKYRARKFTDLVGDERTHRDVLRWVKGWDPIVFPGSTKPKPKPKFGDNGLDLEPRQQRKILLLTGPPGLGKTTLAHVCARQAGYEVVEINASDERSRDVVKGRIRDCVGTENVKGINTKEAGRVSRKAGRPVCLVVDEVDGVVGGSNSGGEGGFIKALIDLISLDQKNSNVLGVTSGNAIKTKKKGDRFRLLRPMILICNDVYHPALRPLRTSNVAEIIHIRKPPLDKVIGRLKSIFDKEGVLCDGDGVRRLCEATWGTSKENRHSSGGTGEGDVRGILVVGEWVAAKMRAPRENKPRLTKRWVEEHMIENLSHGGTGTRSLGRGGAKEAAERVFQEGAGFPKAIPFRSSDETTYISLNGGSVGSVTEFAKKVAIDRLRDMVDTSGETDRIVTDCFSAYPTHMWQDDTLLSKPNAAYEWLHFHDRVSSKVHMGQDWELSPYLSSSILGFHHLFASPTPKHAWPSGDQKRWDENQDQEEPMPFTGPRADYSASETLKANKATLQTLQSSLSIPLQRSFQSIGDISTDLLPNVAKTLTPDVHPTIVGGSGDQKGIVSVRKEGERRMIQHAVEVMGAVGVRFERVRVDAAGGMYGGGSTYVYRMEPPLDDLSVFKTAAKSGGGGGGSAAPTPTRYAIRQALDQEYQKFLLRRESDARQARYSAGGRGLATDIVSTHNHADDIPSGKPIKPAAAAGQKRDFFGRIITDPTRPSSKNGDAGIDTNDRGGKAEEKGKIWVSFHEGYSNAVRKPITLEELMRGF